MVAAIYKDLEPTAKVVHDEKILGAESGTERQIDVTIRSRIATHEILVIVQAKHRSRPADVNVVGEFRSVVRDVGATKGVLVCNAGFSRPAKKYAKKLGIDVCSAYDASKREWSTELKLPLVWIEYEAEAKMETELLTNMPGEPDPKGGSESAKWTTTCDNGITKRSLGAVLANLYNTEAHLRTPGYHVVPIEIPNLCVEAHDGRWLPVRKLVVSFTMRRNRWIGECSFSDFRGLQNEETNILTARVRLTSSDIPITRNPKWTQIRDEGKTFGTHVLVEKTFDETGFKFERVSSAFKTLR